MPFGKPYTKGESEGDEKSIAKGAPPFAKKAFSKRKKGRSAPAQKALRQGGRMRK